MRKRSIAVLGALAAAGYGCASGAPRAPEAPAPPEAPSAPPTPAQVAEPAEVAVTRSPWPAGALEPRAQALSASCGQIDGALARLAQRLAEERTRGARPDPDAVVGLLRAHGVPQVRPRVLQASGRSLDDEAIRAELAAARRPTTRCGVGLARSNEGGEALVGVAVDALADLEPLPIRARTGEWLTFRAILHVPARSAKLVILPSRGAARTAPTSIDPASGSVKATFALDRPGGFTVQLVADLAGGPQPVLEAHVFADVEPRPLDEGPAPGEEAGAGLDDAEGLARMTAALRTSESLPPLARDERLDALARAHAQAMRSRRAAAHDTGDGDLRARFEAEGYAAREIAENVARARSVALAHRALHASPSHRMNLLRPDYTHAGYGVARDDDGTVYACEIFASGLR